IHNQLGDFGSGPYASLAFSSDSKRLAGCAIDKKWLQPGPKALPSGQVHVWELAAEPKAQPAPLPLYTKEFSQGTCPNLVILNNCATLTSATKEGAIDFRDIRDGGIQARLVLGKFALGAMKLSSDRKWLAIEHRPATNEKGIGVPAETFDVGVYDATVHKPT